jgi:hypothetical protein
MKTLLYVLAISLAVSLAAADDDKCKNDLQTFLKCVKDKFEAKPQAEKDAAKKDRQDKADQCFKDAGCDGPDWSKDPEDALKQKMGKMQMPDSVKKCLKDKLIEKIGDKLNECLTKKGVTNVNIKDIIKSAQGAGISMDGSASAEKDGIHAAISAKFNLVKAVDKCSQTKGGPSSVKPLEQCLQKLKDDDKPKICAFIKPCEDAVSADCKKRGQELRKALCECKKEKEAEISGKLRTLGAQDKVGLDDLIKSVAGDQDMGGIIKDVDQCYKDNNEPEPPMIKMAIAMFSGGATPPPKFKQAMSINGTTCIVMADMLQIDADDKTECEPCA